MTDEVKQTAPIRLQSLNIERKGYGPDSGKLVGTVTLMTKGSQIQIRIDEATAQKIVDLCGDGIVKVAQEVAAVMKEDLLAIVSPGDHLLGHSIY